MTAGSECCLDNVTKIMGYGICASIASLLVPSAGWPAHLHADHTAETGDCAVCNLLGQSRVVYYQADGDAPCQRDARYTT